VAIKRVPNESCGATFLAAKESPKCPINIIFDLVKLLLAKQM
jgi:hypothetical protein